MLSRSVLQRATRVVTLGRAVHSSPALKKSITPSISSSRKLHTTPTLYKSTEDAVAEGEQKHAGTYSRTDNTIQVEYPSEEELPSSRPVQGRGGFHFKRTLASFSLEGNVGLVTGGARGLGLVMSQALVVSGADVAIVDLNSR